MDATGLLDDRDELPRRDDVARAAAPAGERLERRRAARVGGLEPVDDPLTLRC